MDFEMLEGVFADLKKYEMSADDADALKQMEGMLMELDWDGIAKMAQSVLA